MKKVLLLHEAHIFSRTDINILSQESRMGGGGIEEEPTILTTTW